MHKGDSSLDGPADLARLYRQAEELHRQGQLAHAKPIYERILQTSPDHVDALQMFGLLALQTRNLDAAIELIGRAVRLRPDLTAAHINLAAALRSAGRREEALATVDAAIALEASHADAHANRGNILLDLGRHGDAVGAYGKAIALKSGLLDAWFGRGNGLAALGRFDEAIADYNQAVALNPGHVAARFNRANALMAMGRYEEALAGFEQALTLAPSVARIHNNRGNALQGLYRFEAAIDSYRQAATCEPTYVEAFNNWGNALWRLGKFEQALARYEEAIALRPDHAGALYNRGNILAELKRPVEALESYAAALALNPDYEFLLGTMVNIKMKMSDWSGIEPMIETCRAGLLEGKATIPPFPTIFLYDEPEVQKIAARLCAERNYPLRNLAPVQGGGGGERIRIGYYSGDLYNNAMTYLIAELFEVHDRERFEFFAFSFGPDRQDAMQKRVMAAFEHYHDVRAMSDRDVGELSRALGIDIAVDLKGYTADGRPGIMAERCAPIQVSYLGYAGTSGADYIDYILSDEIVIPRDGRHAYTEHVVYLPVSYFVNDSQRRISDRAFSRAELSLPERGFVFCSFNSNYKILPMMFDIWMELLRAVEGSVLWLYQDSAIAADNLRRAAQARGMDPGRLIFAESMPLDEHLARHKLADLFLDSWPCNAHTTASDALWAGLPVLTKPGNAFAGRVAASLLHAVGLADELIATSEEDYVARAIAFATDPALLAAVRAKLAANRTTTTLFDGRAFAHNIEAAFVAMVDRHRAGLPPDAIDLG